MALALNGTPATGSISGAAAGTVASGAFTTSVANCVIIAVIGTSDNASGTGPFTVSSISGGGLTWTKRSSQSQTSGFGNKMVQEWWYAIASSTFSAAVTATLSGNARGASIDVFAFSGADTVTPWDVNGSLPATLGNTTNSTTAVTLSVSTTSANTAVIAHILECSGSQTTWTDGSGFSTTANINGFAGSPNFTQLYSQGQYQIFSAAQSSLAVAFTPNSDTYLYFVDAIRQASAAAGYTPYNPWPQAAPILGT